MKQRVDILLVSPSTTPGWRRTDGEFVRALEELGLSVAVARSDFRIARHLRRTMLLTDLAEATAMRHALALARRHYEARAVVFSSSQAAMLQPGRRLSGAVAVRFDVPAALNRRAFGARLLHRLERRALARARLLLAPGLEPHPESLAALRVATPVAALPVPIEPHPAPASERESFALCYAGNPEKKGLDLIAAAWSEAAPSDRHLVVIGLEADAGRSFLRLRGVAEPAEIEWAGVVSEERYRDLSSRAEVFVAASRFEEYGIAQLEALVDGALLVTVASPGRYVALEPARTLDGRLVAHDSSVPALAEALRAAFALPADDRKRYRSHARELLRPYSREELKRRLRDQVLPRLLG